MSRLRFAAPDAGFLPLRAWDPREYCVSFSLSKRWTVRASYIRYVTAEAHRTVRFFIHIMKKRTVRCASAVTYRIYDALTVHRFDRLKDTQYSRGSHARRGRKPASGAAKRSLDMVCART